MHARPAARTHPLTGAPLEPIYVDRHGRTIWPIIGGAPDPEPTPPAPTPPAPTPPVPTPPAPTPPAPTPPAPPVDLGFPANTPVADMAPEQQAAYWKHQARKHEERASGRQDYDQIKTELEQLRQKSMTAEERAAEEQRQAVEAARNEGREQGKTAATKEANAASVTALLDGALRLRGRDDAQVEEALKYVSTDAFVTDGVPDTKAILSYVETIAGPATGRRTPDFGAGKRGNGTGSARPGSVAAVMEERRAAREAAGKK